MCERPTAEGKHGICWPDARADAMRGIPWMPPPQPSDTHIRRRSGTLSTGIISQVARPPHGVDNGCALRQAQGAGDVEAEVLVERHVSSFEDSR